MTRSIRTPRPLLPFAAALALAACSDDSGGAGDDTGSDTTTTGGAGTGDGGDGTDGGDSSSTGGGSTTGPTGSTSATSGDDGSSTTDGGSSTDDGTTSSDGGSTSGTTSGDTTSTGGTTTTTTTSSEDPASCDQLGEPCCSGNVCNGGLECAGGAVCSCVRSVADAIFVDADGTAWTGGNPILAPNDTVMTGFLNTGAPEGLSQVRQLACGLHEDGTVWCWVNTLTDNDRGQLGDGTFDAPTESRQLRAQVKQDGGGTLSGITNIAVADTLGGCAVDEDDGVWCWGSGSSGRLGNDSEMNSNDAVPVVGEDGTGTLAAVRVKVQRDTTCALDAAGELWCWGNNEFSKMGVGTGMSKTDRPVKAMNGLPTDIVDFDLSSDNIYVLLDNGEIWATGSNGSGELGNGVTGGTADEPQPVLESAGGNPVADFTDLRAWYRGVYATRGTPGQMYHWGGNNFGYAPTETMVINAPFFLPSAEWSPMGTEFDYVDVDGHVKRVAHDDYPSTVFMCQ